MGPSHVEQTLAKHAPWKWVSHAWNPRPRASPRLKSPPPRDTPCPRKCLRDQGLQLGGRRATGAHRCCTDLQGPRKGSPTENTPELQLCRWPTEAARCAALHPASHSAPPQAFHSARGRPYFPAGRWAPSCGVASGRPCRSCLWAAREWRAARRRRPLDRPGFVLRGGVLVAGPRETSRLDAMGPSRPRLGLAPLGPGAHFRFLPSAAALFPAATHGLRAALCLRPSGAGGTGPRPRRVFAFGLCPTFSFGFELPAIVGAGF